MKNSFCLYLSLCFVLVPTLAHTIFDENGKFEETWDFNWIGSDEVPAGRWDFWAEGSYGAKNGEYSQTTPAARNPLSSGANGLRLWYVDSTGSPGAASSSPASPYLHFGGPQNELWIRYYTRYQTGFRWWEGGNPGYDKMLRLWTRHGAYPNLMVRLAGSRLGIGAEYNNHPTSTSPLHASDRYGWSAKFSDENNFSHGGWVCVEMYVKMESSLGADDGVGRVWVDGDLVVDNTNVGYVNVNIHDAEVYRQGWVHMKMNNQDFVQNELGPIGRNVAYVDYDDFVIYNQPPPNIDMQGNAFIGPIDWQGDAPVAPPPSLRPGAGLRIISN